MVNATLQATSVRRATGPADWRAAATLLHEYAQWISTATTFDPFVEQPGFAAELADVARHYSAGDVVLFIADLGELPVGTLAAKCHRDRSAELKRMYVRPSARGMGVADSLLDNAIALAARRHCTHVWLETVRGPMDAAISVYRRNGFCIVDDADPTIDVCSVVVMRRDGPAILDAMAAHEADDVLATVLDFAAALDQDDFDRVERLLHVDVVYSIDGVTHRGPGAVVDSYRQGSAAARRIFDHVEFSHSIVSRDDDTLRVDFGDRLIADGDVFHHHSIQDITVDRDRRVIGIVDQPVQGQRASLDEFMTRHARTR